MSVSSFTPAWWLRNPHLQTLWGKFLRRGLSQQTSVERLETADGDFVDLHHFNIGDRRPILFLLHGLEGGIDSHYIQGFLGEAGARDWQVSVMIFRSCGDDRNRTRRLYHSGETTDMALALEHLERRFPSSPLVLAGVSLGGNVLLKYLGETGKGLSRRIAGAAAISVPFDLARSSRHIDRGFSRVYQHAFMKSLRKKAIEKIEEFPDIADAERVRSARTMFAFDDSFTAPVHGFRDAMHYYTESSSIRWLGSISIRTLLLSAVDDPFLPAQVLASVREIAASNSCLELDFPAHGGHVGFVGGVNPLRPDYYLERRACDFLAHCIATRPTD
jgi:predicted alpha/beta-fold hydrolase